MQGLRLDFSKSDNQLKMIVDADACGDILFEDAQKFVNDSEYAHYKIYEGSLLNLIKSIKERIREEAGGEHAFVIGESQPAKISITVSEDEMEAYITIAGAYGGRQPRMEDIHQAIALNGVVRGISHKTINQLLEHAPRLSPGQEMTKLLAKGLPSRVGKSTHMVAKVETLRDRVLKPTENDDGSVDMRDFGETLSVDAGTVVAEIKQPTVGRAGYTVTHEAVPGKRGKDIELTLGANTAKDETYPNLIRAAIDGQPKMIDNAMTISSVYTVKGVNVRSGNIKYKGCVLVKGDVAEKMLIEANGDVIVEGFVEAATIKSGGDIILSQGCSGSSEKRDCVLDAQGKISIQHGQGVSIKAKSDINIVRQIAHSTIDAHGQVIVGRGKKLNGSIFACKVIARNSVRAGNIGAVSGSKVEFDFTAGLEKYIKKQAQLQVLREDLASTNADHLIQFSKLNRPSNRAKAESKISELESALHSEQLLLQWLTNLETELAENIETYKRNAKVIAMNNLYPNATVTMQGESLTTSKETKKNMLLFQDEVWQQQPYRGLG